MARNVGPWKIILFLNIAILNVFVISLPIGQKFSNIDTTDDLNQLSIETSKFPEEENYVKTIDDVTSENVIKNEITPETIFKEKIAANDVENFTNSLLRELRPGQEVRNYAVKLNISGHNFIGRTVMDVQLELNRNDPLRFHSQGLEIQKVMTSIFTDANLQESEFNDGDTILEIFPTRTASTLIVVIEYSGRLSQNGRGLYEGTYDDTTYMAMNLHPFFARSVFPCIDEPSESSIISFTINDVEYDNIVMNSMLEENSETQFRPLQGPPHLWGMVAHNFNNAYFPTTNVVLNGRNGVTNQESQASIAINHYFHALNEWTSKPYLEIVLDQNGRMNVIALPDTDREWYALSTVCIWEPYVFMESVHSVKQRMLGLTKIAEAMARQWFGYVIHPQNWRHQWITNGLATYVAYEVLKDFQTPPADAENALLDGNTLFVTEIIQESLLRDAYISSQRIEPAENLFDEVEIRQHINGLLKYKAPALLRMLRLVLGGAEDDFVKHGATVLLNSRSLQTVNTFNLLDAINSGWLFDGNEIIDNIADFLNPWLHNTGYPIINVALRQGGVLITQERFAFTPVEQRNYIIPLTYATSSSPNFDDDSVYPAEVMDGTRILDIDIGDDWVIFNIQGQGYYRVNYDQSLWDRIIDALEDPERREEIHPLNRASILDDALNLARAGKLDYDIALRIALTMEHEDEYAVWRAFLRNMEFLRKHLMALVDGNGDFDDNIYERMMARTIVAFEEEIGFEPETVIEPSMVSLMRGLVMDHACKANYDPCIATAIDLFYDPNDSEIVNPNIPKDLRPAVYCTMVREGGEDEITALHERMDVEPSLYERLVILESLACSQDANFIRNLLEETIAANGPYSMEENLRIFKAVVESSHDNARVALNFIALRTNEIRNMYGGPERLEEVIATLAENMVNPDLATDFVNWVDSRNNNLQDSEGFAELMTELVKENSNWESRHLESVYEWIDVNDAPSLFISAFLIVLSLIITLFNN